MIGSKKAESGNCLIGPVRKPLTLCHIGWSDWAQLVARLGEMKVTRASAEAPRQPSMAREKGRVTGRIKARAHSGSVHCVMKESRSSAAQTTSMSQGPRSFGQRSRWPTMA